MMNKLINWLKIIDSNQVKTTQLHPKKYLAVAV